MLTSIELLFWQCTRGVAIALFFFFQAEDGIRDVAVTGVQTCALPICNNSLTEALHDAFGGVPGRGGGGPVTRFGTTRAVDGLDLTVPVGLVYGVSGLNGAGKANSGN